MIMEQEESITEEEMTEEKTLKCPFCGVVMDKLKRADVIIDRCPNCFGIWLHKGELDKIVLKRKKHYRKQQDWGKPRVGEVSPYYEDETTIDLAIEDG
jgi:Zn-finger nucleic acid-binding protein